MFYVDNLEKRIEKIKEFNLGRANETSKMRELLENIIMDNYVYYTDVDVKATLQNAITKADEFLNT